MKEIKTLISEEIRVIQNVSAFSYIYRKTTGRGLLKLNQT
jgi:hypothetical protein